MADMWRIAAAWEKHAVAVGKYWPEAASQGYGPVSGASLSAALVPTYMKELPMSDGWGTAYEFEVEASGGYVIRSMGGNGRRDAESNGATSDPDADIIFSNGLFVAHPAGLSVVQEAAGQDIAPQRQVLDDMRAIAQAWEAFATRNRARKFSYRVSDTAWSRVTAEELVAALVPTYAKELPLRDPWLTPYEFELADDDYGYVIRSLRVNSRRDPDSRGATVDPGADIIFSNGAFVAYPKGY
jgi:hypothetical protein